jgi:signal peptidase I
MTAQERKRIRWWLAALLLLAAPLAGALYVGRRWVVAGTLLLTAGFLAATWLPGIAPDRTAAAPLALVALLAAALLLLIAALVSVRRDPTAPAAPWRRWYVLVLAALAVFGLLQIEPGGRAQAFRVPSGSMAPTLLPGDSLIAVMAPVRADTLPARGDILLYVNAGTAQTIYLHRLVALPGERFRMQGGIPHIDGVALPRTPAGSPGDRHFEETLPGGRRILVMEVDPNGPLDDTEEITVPPGHVVLLGDNRDNAADSRVNGPVAIADLRGVAQLVYWSAGWERIGMPLR